MSRRRIASVAVGLTLLVAASGILAAELPAVLAREDRAAALASIQRQAVEAANRAETIEHVASLVSRDLADQLEVNRALTNGLAAQQARMARLQRSIDELRD